MSVVEPCYGQCEVGREYEEIAALKAEVKRLRAVLGSVMLELNAPFMDHLSEETIAAVDAVFGVKGEK